MFHLIGEFLALAVAITMTKSVCSFSFIFNFIIIYLDNFISFVCIYLSSYVYCLLPSVLPSRVGILGPQDSRRTR